MLVRLCQARTGRLGTTASFIASKRGSELPVPHRLFQANTFCPSVPFSPGPTRYPICNSSVGIALAMQSPDLANIENPKSLAMVQECKVVHLSPDSYVASNTAS